jgi:hypothetical protein
MPVPVRVTGQVLSASDVDTWFVPRWIHKTGATSRASTTTLTADPHLTLPVDANGTYQITCEIDYEADGVADLKIGWTVPASAAGNWTWAGYTTADNPSFNGGNTFASTGPMGGAGAGQARIVKIGGLLAVSSTAGNLTLTWAQNVSSGTPTILHTYSYLRIDRVG